ncbi:hypothetical protein Vi05172_g3733 [Venturia inaequalis]|nr:hypothetical protein Vi05172_g3733 [Venturia inaequalis]
MAPISNQNQTTANKMTLIFGILSVLLAFVGVALAIQTWSRRSGGRLASYELSFVLGRRNS